MTGRPLVEENSEMVCAAMKIGRKHRWLAWIGVGLLLPASGCHRYLVQTPNLLQNQDPHQVYAACPESSRTAEAAVLYATDRAIVEHSKINPTYGHGRANSLAFGVAAVSLQPHPSWKELIQESTQVKRGREFELKLAGVREYGRIQAPIEQMVERGPDQAISQASARQDRTEVKAFHELLRGRLGDATHKDVYVFVHGFNNTFDDAVFRAAEVWHFMGRVGVPIAYTWPAGLGGIRGYAYDRESGEFTVGHLRELILCVAECPGVERVHLVAHSRGVDVTISALRELHLIYTAQGKSTQRELKLENLVLAAPDVDEDVFMQRFVGENLLQAARRTTIYASQYDKAIELTDIVFASRRRLGTLAIKDFSPKMKQGLAKLPNVQFIECKISGWFLSHSYVFTQPAALSDMILVLRDRRDPGAANGRPLRQPAEGIWELTDDYLAR
jgi:esterase/lipase superfamily enzyme